MNILSCLRPSLTKILGTDWTLHPYWGEAVNFDDLPGATMWVQEDAAYLDRCCSCFAPGCRPTLYCTVEAPPPPGSGATLTNAANNVQQDEASSGLTHKKGRSCGQNSIVACTNQGDTIRCPMCCCLPYLNTYGGAGRLLGRTRYIFDACLFVPTFLVSDAEGRTVYRLRPDTCALGCCACCECGGRGGKCCRLSYRVRDPVTSKPIEDAAVSDIWGGFGNKCCARKNMHAVKWPSTATREMRATLTGSALLINMTFKERLWSENLFLCL